MAATAGAGGRARPLLLTCGALRSWDSSAGAVDSESAGAAWVGSHWPRSSHAIAGGDTGGDMTTTAVDTADTDTADTGTAGTAGTRISWGAIGTPLSEALR